MNSLGVTGLGQDSLFVAPTIAAGSSVALYFKYIVVFGGLDVPINQETKQPMTIADLKAQASTHTSLFVMDTETN